MSVSLRPLPGPVSMNRFDHPSNAADLVVAGTVKDSPSSDIDLVVAIERVVADNAPAEILDVYCCRTCTDADGRFADRYTPPAEVRGRLHGWVMCTVGVQPRVPGAQGCWMVVRWQRQSSDDLIAGLSALLGNASFEAKVVAR